MARAGGQKGSSVASNVTKPVDHAEPMRLRDALRQARIEAADRTGVVVELRDAEVARLEILNDALDSLFAEIPPSVEMFDRGISQGDTPRLWIDMVAHVLMGRDKRMYRFVQDTRHGRVVLAEAHDVPTMVKAVTDYIARRMIEREHALATMPMPQVAAEPVKKPRSRFLSFLFGVIFGVAALFGAALLLAARGH
jgi:hypothetical protein